MHGEEGEAGTSVLQRTPRFVLICHGGFEPSATPEASGPRNIDHESGPAKTPADATNRGTTNWRRILIMDP